MPLRPGSMRTSICGTPSGCATRGWTRSRSPVGSMPPPSRRPPTRWRSSSWCRPTAWPSRRWPRSPGSASRPRSSRRVRGIVGYAPLHDPVAAAAHLRELRRFPLVVGVRRLIQDEPPGFTSRPGLRAGVALLAAEDLVFDLCVREPQLGEVVDLVRATPEVRFVLDHLGKPRVGADPTRWRRDLRALAELPNVVAKLSGLMTEVVPGAGAAGDVRPYLEYALEVFGPQRCLFGSDWPVLTLAGSYPEWRDTVLDAVARTLRRRGRGRPARQRPGALPTPASPIPTRRSRDREGHLDDR